jgi:hypothetical protein
MPDVRPKVALFLGSGFSAEFGLPTTNRLHETLLDIPNGGRHDRREAFINLQISRFWKAVFGWVDRAPKPSLEDHFTQIDLAANSGHNLGSWYSPKILRALRRMTIHRILTVLDARAIPSPTVGHFLRQMSDRFQIGVVTTNWDIMVERSLSDLQVLSHYGVGETTAKGYPVKQEGIPLLKLHGSGNWGYCDCCRNLIAFDIAQLGKAAVHLGLFLERDDFCLFGEEGQKIAGDLQFLFRSCLACGGRCTARVVTFSYHKDLSVRAFQTIWDHAHALLRTADRWLFVGYSMPEADIEIRHLLKSAQLARREPRELSIEVVLGEDERAADRYARFFGQKVIMCKSGLHAWIGEHLNRYCRGRDDRAGPLVTE